MRSVTVRLDDLRTTVLNLGFVGENEHTQIRIDSKKMYDQYPTASASLTVCPPEGESYPAVIEREGDFVLWTITDSDLTHEGSGEIQLSFTVSETVAKSYIGRFKVSRSIVPTGEIPEGIDDFLTRAGAALTVIPETIDEALAEAKASGEFDGPQGPAGQDGQDGYSPTATVVKSGKVATITITDKNGTTTAQVHDGEDGGDPTAIIDDTAGEGDTNKVWSADKSYDVQQSVLTEIANKADIIISSASGSVASFDDGADGMPLHGLVVEIDENENGFSKCNIARTGKNLIGGIALADAVVSSMPSATIDTDLKYVSFAANASTEHVIVGYVSTDPKTILFKFKENTQYTFFMTFMKNSGATGSSNLKIVYTDNTSDIIPMSDTPDTKTTVVFTSDSGKTIRAFYKNNSSGTTYLYYEESGIFEGGLTEQDFDEWVGTVYPVTFPISVTAGGSFNATTGVLTVNTDPVTTYDLDPVQISTFLGWNGIYADTGGIAVQYRADTKKYADGFYKKPSTGIPASDLKSGVIPTVPAIATSTQIKMGTNSIHPIAPNRQNESVFYALAKLAGADMASLSGETVGVYPDAQKVAIQKMLGIYELPWELIREDTATNATEADVEITVDGDGNAYKLTDVYMQVWTPQQETAASIGDYGTVRCYYDSSNYITSQMNTWSQAANAAARYGQVLLENKNGAILNIVTQNATQYSSVGLIGRTNIPNSDALLKIGTFAFDKIVIKKVTGTVKYKLYGRRKWN